MITKLEEQKKQLISYLLSKVDAEDWHAVADAAMDLRETEARLEVYKLYNRNEER